MSFKQNFQQNKFIAHVAVYMRLYDPGSDYKITWKCIMDKNKT